MRRVKMKDWKSRGVLNSTEIPSRCLTGDLKTVDDIAYLLDTKNKSEVFVRFDLKNQREAKLNLNFTYQGIDINDRAP